MKQRLEHLARTYLPPTAARFAKRIVVYPRYVLQVRACRAGFRRYGHLVIVHGIWMIPDSWVRKRLACPDADAPPSQSIHPLRGGQVGGLNDYKNRPDIHFPSGVQRSRGGETT